MEGRWRGDGEEMRGDGGQMEEIWRGDRGGMRDWK